MAVDVKAWRRVVEDVVAGLADEAMQRRAWFGLGPEVSSPDDEFCMFFGDAAVEEFLERDDTGLGAGQRAAGRHLFKLMRDLSDQTPEHIEPEALIDDPRWQEIRNAAARFAKLLHTGNMAA
ncbi:MAG TPA: hypothetical protein VG308_17975 [Stellaceae bacterium]|jgi:hypothetical protein|nr:hypothetical protein [Stellaceae bacterium]